MRQVTKRYPYHIDLIDASNLYMHFPPLILVAVQQDPYCCTSRAAIDNETNHPERIRYAKSNPNNSRKELYTVARTNNSSMHACLAKWKVFVFCVIPPFILFFLFSNKSINLQWFHSS